MSPINKKKIKKLRKSLDKLDNSLIKLIKKRTSIVKQILKLKKSKSQIVDKKRIKFILNQVRKKSIKNKIDPKLTNRIWKNMILSYIDYERRKFKKK
jgi:chorismate mutase